MMGRFAIAVLVVLIFGGATAAAAAEVSLAPSQALQCMTPPESERSTLSYPAEALKRKEGGVVEVELTFDDSARPPDVKALNEPLTSLAEGVRQHVRRYRVPCLGAGQKAVIRQDFRFDPTDGRKVLWTTPRDANQTERRGLLACLRASKPRPSYPLSALRREDQGVVVLGVMFKDAANAPEITVLDDTPESSLINAAKEHALSLRLPCHDGAVFEVQFQYDFMIDGADRLVLKDLTLPEYLRATKDIAKAQVYFSFNEMKCPFDVRIALNQPIGNNRIGEVGQSVPERVFFLDWLSRQRLILPTKQQNLLIGKSLNVSVPCGVLNLGATSGGGASQ
jgi:hypothetical protein